MRRHARLLLLVGAACGACFAAPAVAVTQNAAVKATVIKPLTLTSTQNLDLGTVTLKPGSWSGATVGISRAGLFSCANANLVCSGVTQVASYKVTGTNKQTVTITAPDVKLVNQSDPTQSLTLKVDSPGQVVLTSSGQPGTSFNLGGSVTLSSATTSGVYSGTFNVTVDYQ